MKRLLFAALLLFPVLSLAAVDPTGQTYDWIKVATEGVTGRLQTIGIRLFYTLTVLQLIITMYGQMATGDVETAIAKLAKAVLWTLFCLWLMLNNTAYNFIANTIQYFLNHAISWTTSTQSDFSVNGIIVGGMDALNNTIRAIAKSAIPTSTIGWLSALATGGGASLVTIIFGAIMIGIIVIIVIVTCAYIALKVFMVKIESALILAVLPLSLAFLGLSALREQGFAPFKSMLALIYRIVILGMVVGGMVNIGNALANYANSDADPNIVQVVLVAVFGYVLLAFLAYKSDQIASSLASGSANLGSGDAAGAAMAGAAAGAAVAAASGVAAGAGKSGIKSMAEMMSNLSGGGGSINNASTRGTGKTPEAAPTKASASIPSSAPSSGPSSATASNGAPRREGSANGSGTASHSPAAPSPAAPSSADSSPAATPASSPSETPSSVNGGAPAKPSTSPEASNAVDGSKTSADATPPGSGVNAGIGGAPQRDISNELGRLADALSAPKKPTHGENLKKHLGTLGQHTANEKAATHVSVNTHPHD